MGTMRRKAVNALTVLCVVLFIAVIANAAPKKRVMPWMCLERCGSNKTEIDEHLKQIREHRDVITAVSYEAYNLGPNGALVENDFTEVLPQIISYGLKSFAMISSYPYPPEFLDWMRYLFDNPQPFIATAVQKAVSEGFTGYNVDFEPTAKATPADAANYGKFLSLFADALHAKGKLLTVDVATWNSIWNYTEIAKSRVDTVMTMATYVGNWDTFQEQFNRALSAFPIDRLGIGLLIENPNNNLPYTDAELKLRFDLIKSRHVQEIDIWRSPVPENWWKFINDFANSE